MRLGVMTGYDTLRSRAERLAGLVDDGKLAERLGLDSFWIPQIPGYLDAMTASALLGVASDRIEIGTAVVPIQTRHPIAMAQQALTTQVACAGRFTLGVGPSHDWIVSGQLGLPYARPARLVRDYVEILNASLSAPGRVDVENENYCVHGELNVAGHGEASLLIAALGPVMLKHAGEHADGTILWMADERTVSEHVVPRITAAADGAGRTAPRVVAGVPVALCPESEVDEVRRHAGEVLGHARMSPNYLRLLEYGDAEDIGDVMAAGDEASVLARLRRYRDAGVTDLAARIVPLGNDVESRIESWHRSFEYLGSIRDGL